ncbi:hypothetical protein BH10BAC5_BH10BAC5_24420 [soil metagenome]
MLWIDKNSKTDFYIKIISKYFIKEDGVLIP